MVKVALAQAKTVPRELSSDEVLQLAGEMTKGVRGPEQPALKSELPKADKEGKTLSTRE